MAITVNEPRRRSSPTIRFACPHCGLRIWSTPGGLRAHIEQKHPKIGAGSLMSLDRWKKPPPPAA